MTADNSAEAPASVGGSTSRSLLAGAQQDDPAAWVRLVNLYAPLVATWCRRSGVAEQDVVDLLQEVFAAVARNLHRFRKQEADDSFRAWLATIARNKVRDYYRRRSSAPAAAGGTEASLRLAQVLDPQAISWGTKTDDDAGNGAADFGDVLSRALASIRGEFHERTWQAFWSTVIDGRPAAAVAAELNMRPGAIRVAKSRVLMRLRCELGDVAE